MFEVNRIKVAYAIARKRFAHVQRECRDIPGVLDVTVDEVSCARLSVKHRGTWPAISAHIEEILGARRAEFESPTADDATAMRLTSICGCDAPADMPGADVLLGQLIEAGHIAFSANGEFYYAGRMRAAIEAVDAWFTSGMRSRFEPEELYSSPAIGLDDVTRLSDLEQANREMLIASHLDGTSLKTSDLARCHAEWALPTAPCLKLYLRHADTAIERDLTYTTRGACFRNERKGRFAFERLESFQQREVVFIGAKKFILRKAAEVLDAFEALCADIGLAHRRSVANDPFFINPLRKLAYDIDGVVKTEIRAASAPGKDLSVASLDYHGSFFGQRCAIGLAGSAAPAYSACFGVGLERVVWTLLCQRGLSAFDELDRLLRRC